MFEPVSKKFSEMRSPTTDDLLFAKPDTAYDQKRFNWQHLFAKQIIEMKLD